MDLPVLDSYELIHVDCAVPINIQDELQILNALDRHAKMRNLTGPFITAKFQIPKIIHKFAEQNMIVSFARYYPRKEEPTLPSEKVDP